ncbi:MAG: PKD domain-containing protein [bacterium]|nr:MAG: PKD domain-containing protein [bacterium]
MSGKPLSLICTVFLLSALASCGADQRQPTQASTPGVAAQSEDRPVPSLFNQFFFINPEGGQPFTFRYWNNEAGGFIGNDPTMRKHYQGIHRVQGADGTAYLYLTRNGNPIELGTDYPGEILIVEMGSRTRSGGALAMANIPQRQPLVEDHTVRSIHTDGIDPIWQGEDVDWKHPGSGQVVGDRLFIPVEKTCNYDPDEGHCVGEEEGRGALLVFNMSDPLDTSVTPANPQFMCQIEKFQVENSSDLFSDLPKIGTLGVTLENGTYLFAHTTGGSYNRATALTFYELDETKLCTAQDPSGKPAIERLGHWDADDLQGLNGVTIGEDEWRKEGTFFGVDKKLDWQMINFLHDNNGDLYLVTTDKSSSSAIAVHDDWAKLFKILRNGDDFTVQLALEKHMYMSEPTDIGSFDAVGGVYVSAEGQLILYSGGHDNKWPNFIFTEIVPPLECDWDDRCQSLELGEFASLYFHPPLVGTPEQASADEGSLASFGGCSFTDAVTSGQDWSVQVDWGDGTSETFPALPAETLPLGHLYDEGPSVHTVLMTVADSDGFSGRGTLEVTVNNVPPAVTIESIATEYGGVLGEDLPFTFTGVMLELSGSYSDPGSLDTHTGDVVWGDGAVTDLGALTGPVQVRHSFAVPGSHPVTFTVADDDGGTGSDSQTIRVVSLLEGLGEIVEMLRPHAGNRHVHNAIGDLEGQSEGLAANGAIDLLEKDNTNAALVHIRHAIRELESARDEDPALEVDVPLNLLVLALGTLDEL